MCLLFDIIASARGELNRFLNFSPSTLHPNSTPSNPRKRKHQTTLKLPNTWTHIFVCVGKVSDYETPNQTYKKMLLKNNLRKMAPALIFMKPCWKTILVFVMVEDMNCCVFNTALQRDLRYYTIDQQLVIMSFI